MSQLDRELVLALARRLSGEGGGTILPIKLADAEHVPPMLRQFPWMELQGGNVDRLIAQLIDAVHHSSPRGRFETPPGDVAMINH
jgi:hypothetical protein